MRSNVRTMAAAAAMMMGCATGAQAQEGTARATALAKGNADAKAAMAFLSAQSSRIVDANLRKAVKELLEEPAPSFMELHPDAAARESVRKALADAGLLAGDVTVEQLFPPLVESKKAAQPFSTAPGGTPDHHHAYPGGLAVHTAFNLHAALDLAANYKKSYGITLDHDIVIAAPILHDAMKAWCLQWTKEGTFTVQATIAGTSSHHIFIAAEALHRKLPPGFVVALASAHNPPTGADAKIVVDYLRAAAILANVDAVGARVLSKGDGGFSPARLPSVEALINHMSDHDYVLKDPAAAFVAEALIRIARAEPGGDKLGDAQLNWMRHRIQTKVPGMKLYAWLREGGDTKVRDELRKLKIAIVDPADGAQ